MTRSDWLTSQLTGQGTFEKFCIAGVGGYQPTFCGDQPRSEERRELADAFDAEMANRGSAVRAHRCHWERGTLKGDSRP